MDDKLNYKNIIKQTLTLFPEYRKTNHFKDNDQELQYSFIAGFVRHVIDRIKNDKDGENSMEIKKYFDFFNEILNSEDVDLVNLGTVEIIENLVQDKRIKSFSEQFLNQKAKKVLEQVLEYTGEK